MLRLCAAVHKKPMAFDEKPEHIFCHHPYFALFFAGIIAPIMVLSAVALDISIIAIPMGLIFGWL